MHDPGIQILRKHRELKQVFCKNLQYGPCKSKIIMEQVQALLNNVWMEKCGGPWGRSIFLASKPHQEHIINIDGFIWRMCVSCRKINGITNTFEFPILRCYNDISTVGARSNKTWIISLNARQLYYQISVCRVDREKLAFFIPYKQKYMFLVVPFGPTNTPGFYSATMKNFKY